MNLILQSFLFQNNLQILEFSSRLEFFSHYDNNIVKLNY